MHSETLERNFHKAHEKAIEKYRKKHGVKPEEETALLESGKITYFVKGKWVMQCEIVHEPTIKIKYNNKR